MLEYSPFSDEILDDPFPIYRQLRDEAPAYYIDELDSWALSRFDDIWNAGAAPATFRSPGPNLLSGLEDGQESWPSQESDRGSLFSLNPPVHTKLRQTLSPHFRPRAIMKLEPVIREIVSERIAKVLPMGRCDIVQDLGLKLSVKVTCLIIGLPVEDGDYLAGVVNRFFMREPGIRGMAPDAQAAAEEIREYLHKAIIERRKRGSEHGDLLDDYLGFKIDGTLLSDEELAGHLTTLVVGGTETLPKVVAGGVLQLHRHPAQRAELIANPSLISDACTEIARYEMPTQFLTRTIAKQVEMHGQTLRVGQGVLFLYRSGNRDEREFDEPDRFDIHRCPKRILTFGHGAHVCMGLHVAHLEARVLVEELLANMPDYAIEESEVIPARSEFVTGYLAVPITFKAR